MIAITLESEPRLGRSEAWARLLAGGLAIALLVWIAASYAVSRGLGLTLAGTLLLGAVALGLIRRGHRGLSETVRIVIDTAGIRASHGERHEEVAWSEVSAVEVDEDRLIVKVLRRDRKPLEIDGPLRTLEPETRSLSVYDIADLLRAAFRDAPARSAHLPRS